MTKQEMIMGYEYPNGRVITLAEHEENYAHFLSFRGEDAARFKKEQQIRYYRALQEDWEEARDSEMGPFVVDSVDDLPLVN